MLGGGIFESCAATSNTAPHRNVKRTAEFIFTAWVVNAVRVAASSSYFQMQLATNKNLAVSAQNTDVNKLSRNRLSSRANSASDTNAHTCEQ